MTVPGNLSSPLLATAADSAAAGAFQISRSLRFSSGDSAYLNRTPSSAGNRRTWSWSGWVKRSKLSSQKLFRAGASGTECGIQFHSGTDNLAIRVEQFSNSSFQFQLDTSQLFRDAAAWYHIVVAFDSTQATASNRVKLYVNGSQVTEFATENYPAQNLDGILNNNVEHRLGSVSGSSNYFDGYLAEVNFVDGQSLAPTDFGAYDDNNVWQPKQYSGTYGTNGFRLDFSDATSTTTISEDSSGNNNDFTANNISVASGSGNDSVIDTPTNYEASSGNNGGNYSTMNPLLALRLATLSNGNLDVTGGSLTDNGWGTIAVPSGKWYAEVTVTAGGGSTDVMVGVKDIAQQGSTDFGAVSRGYGYSSSGQKVNSDSLSSYAASYTNGDVIGIALDLDAGTITFYKNGSSQGAAFSGISSSYSYHFCCFCRTTSDTVAWNFGQRSFAYTPPSNHLAVCTTNLPDPTIADGSTVFDVKTFSGTGSTQSITGLGFSPDLVWLKCTNASKTHRLYDAVRGATKVLQPDIADAEGTDSAGLTSFDSTGFTLGGSGGHNGSTDEMISWAWDAGTSTASNTDGTITSNVRASQTNGCSIVTYTSPNSSSNQSVGHGLNAQPGLVIWKNRDRSYSWDVWHQSLSGTETLQLDNNAITRTVAIAARPGSSVFETKTSYTHNGTDDYLALCFAPIEGFSAFGSYTGNGVSNNGPFVFTGHRARFLIIKCSTKTGEDWVMMDTERDTYNDGDSSSLYASLAHANNSNNTLITTDILSNGFKVRATNAAVNQSGETYLYMSFASHPFKTARAR